MQGGRAQARHRHAQSAGYAATAMSSAHASALAAYAPILGDLIPTDATSGKGVPLTQEEWDLVFAAAGITSRTLSHSWDLGAPASGNITATVGLDLTAVGTIEYQQDVTGWTHKALQFTETNMERVHLDAGDAPDPSAVSSLWFAYIDFTANPGGNGRKYINISTNATQAHLAGTTTPRIRVECAGVNSVGTADQVTGGVRPVFFLFDRTNEAVKAYTDQEIITGTYSASVGDGEKGFGGTTTAAPPAFQILIGAAWAGANAEWSDADVHAVMVALGFDPDWTP